MGGLGALVPGKQGKGEGKGRGVRFCADTLRACGRTKRARNQAAAQSGEGYLTWRFAPRRRARNFWFALVDSAGSDKESSILKTAPFSRCARKITS